MSEPLVIVGNGMAAARLCEELAQRALGRYAVAVVGEEPRLAYNRVLLSSVLAGEIAANDISLKPASWWSDRGVTLCYGACVTAVDVAARTVSLSGRHGAAIRQARLRHRFAGYLLARRRRQSARRDDVPQHGRRRVHFACCAPRRAPSWSAAGFSALKRLTVSPRPAPG